MRIVWLILTALTQVLAVVLSLASGLRTRLLGPDPTAMFMVVGANLALVAILLTLRIQLEGDATQNAVSKIEKAFNELRTSRSELKALLDSDFYARFTAELREARVGVAITHLDTRPPTLRNGTPGELYYSELSKVIKGSKATFRRVERLSPEKIAWIEQLMQEYRGVRNFSLAVIRPVEKDRKLPHVSVQLIDSHTSVLVAVAEHEGTQGPRDIWLHDDASTRLWQRYYDDILWRPSTKLVENGKVDNITWVRLKQEITQG
jgi:hypothetical protein